MSRFFSICMVVAVTLLLSGRPVSAGSVQQCIGFSTAAISYVQKIRAAARAAGGGCTGHDMRDRFWSTDRSVQRTWCLSVSSETADKRLDEMREAVAKCSYCNAYSNAVTSAAADNIKLGCGFKNDGDKRWLNDKDFHFNGCMTAKDCNEICTVGLACYDACVVEVSTIQKILDPIVSQVTVDIEQCKTDKGVGKTSSALSRPKTIPPLPDIAQRAKHPPKPVKRCQSPTATKDCNAAGIAAVKPAAKSGSNTSAMDRLSGDSPLSSSGNRSSKTGEGGSRRAPAGGGASAVAKPDTPSMKADPTVDMGKCATCGKSPPTPPR